MLLVVIVKEKEDLKQQFMSDRYVHLPILSINEGVKKTVNANDCCEAIAVIIIHKAQETLPQSHNIRFLYEIQIHLSPLSTRRLVVQRDQLIG